MAVILRKKGGQQKRIGGSVKGSLFTLGDISVGVTELAGKAVQYEKDRRLLMYMSADGGGYMSRGLAVAFTHLVRKLGSQANRISRNWEPYEETYARWKREKYSGKGPWNRTGQLLKSFGPLRSKTAGRTVGFDPNERAHKHSYGGFKGYGASVTVDEVAKAMEYGSHSHPGMPSRALIGPVFELFSRKHFPQIVRATEKAIHKAMLKNHRTPPSREQANYDAFEAAIGDYSKNSGMEYEVAADFESNARRFIGNSPEMDIDFAKARKK